MQHIVPTRAHPMNTPNSLPASFNAAARSRPGIPGAVRQATPGLVKLWRLMALHKLTVLLSALIVGALTALVVSRITPIYAATATVLLEANKSKVVSIEEIYSAAGSNREYFQTQAEFLRSRDVSLRVIKDLGLTEHPLFDPRQKGNAIVARVRGLLGMDSSQDMSGEAIESAVLATFQEQLSVTPIRSSQLIQVRFESPEPRLAAAVANSVAEQFIRADLDARFRMTQTANGWLNERLAVLRDKLDSSEKALQQYKDEAGILDARGASQGGAGRQLDEVQQRLVQARIQRSQAEQIYKQVRTDQPGRYDVPAVFNNPSVARAREAEGAAAAKLADAQQRYGPAHPLFLAAQGEVEAARLNTKRQADAVIGSIAKEFEVAVATERALEESMGRSRGNIQDLNRKEVKLNALEREAASNRQLYQTFLSRVKETSATGDFLTPVARVVDAAVAPQTPAKPPRGQIIVMGVLAGLVLGGLIAWYRERLSNVVRTVEDVDVKLQRPLLAAVPVLTGDALQQSSRLQLTQPASMFAEAIRTVMTGVQLSTIGAPRIVVGFTSSVPGEGKSTIAMNFALEQARTRSVLLIDLDLRRPVIGERIGLPSDAPGVVDLLTGRLPIDGCIHHIPSMGLRVMPAGRALRNPLDLLMGTRFVDTIRTLHQMFDVVVIDAPPMHPVSDALLIARECTGIIYVVKSEEAPLPVIQKSLERVEQAGLNLFGLILNGHDFRRAERYYGDYSSPEKYGYESVYDAAPAKTR